MLQLINSNFLNYKKLSMLPVLFLIPLAYWSIYMPVTTIVFLIFPAVISDIYFYENKARCNRFFISLPVSVRSIVQAKYLSFLLLLMIIVLYQWLIASGIDIVAGKTDNTYQWEYVLIGLSLGIILTSFIIPLYYVFRSFFTAFSVMIIIVFIFVFVSLDPLVTVLGMEDYIVFNDLDKGFPILIEAYFPFFPYVTLLIGTGIIYYISSQLSVALLSRQDK